MARINLLPWREERRQARQKEFYAMLVASAIAAVVIAFAIVSWHGAQIDGQNERNEYLRQQISSLDEKIEEIKQLDEKKAQLLKRKEIIEGLQADRSQMVHLFDSLVRTIPDGVVLTSIKQEGKKMTLEGRSQSSARVSTYMRNLEGSGWMTKPQLSIIEAKRGDTGLPFVFTLSVTVANPNAPVDTDGDGVPDTIPAGAPPEVPAAPETAAAAGQEEAAQATAGQVAGEQPAEEQPAAEPATGDEPTGGDAPPATEDEPVTQEATS